MRKTLFVKAIRVIAGPKQVREKVRWVREDDVGCESDVGVTRVTAGVRG